MNWGTNEKGTNEMGDQWDGGPMSRGTNEMGDQWNEWCMGANWGINEMGDQWDGGPMRWGTNEMGDQWDGGPMMCTHVYILSWHKMVYMRDLSCTFICINFAYMLSMYLKYVVYRHFNFILEPHCVLMFLYTNGGLKSWWQYAETWLFFNVFT